MNIRRILAAAAAALTAAAVLSAAPAVAAPEPDGTIAITTSPVLTALPGACIYQTYIVDTYNDYDTVEASYTLTTTAPDGALVRSVTNTLDTGYYEERSKSEVLLCDSRFARGTYTVTGVLSTTDKAGTKTTSTTATFRYVDPEPGQPAVEDLSTVAQPSNNYVDGTGRATVRARNTRFTRVRFTADPLPANSTLRADSTWTVRYRTAGRTRTESFDLRPGQTITRTYRPAARGRALTVRVWVNGKMTKRVHTPARAR